MNLVTIVQIYKHFLESFYLLFRRCRQFHARQNQLVILN